MGMGVYEHLHPTEVCASANHMMFSCRHWFLAMSCMTSLHQTVSASANSEMPSGCCNNGIVVDSPSVDSSGLCVAAIKFLSSIMASNSVTVSTVSFVRDSTAELVKEIVEYLKAKTMQSKSWTTMCQT
jgi:hypothetical protein